MLEGEREKREKVKEGDGEGTVDTEKTGAERE